MPVAVMGVLNVTPDSFSDGGKFLDPAKAIEHGRAMVADGAAMVDVGGESTRPGAAGVSEQEEIDRVVPVVEALARQTRVSIDTRKAGVARAAVEAGATVINDVSSSLYEVAAATGVAWVAMHMQGEPSSMQARPEYEDVVANVSAHLFERAATAQAAGVKEIWIDPGIGFGKTVQHNLALLGHIDVLTASPWPVVIGTSRKSFLNKLLANGEDVPAEDRLEGSLATALWCAERGVSVVRVHDVRATVRALKILDAMSEAA